MQKYNLWILASKSNPRWSGGGTSEMPVGMGMPTECRNLVEAYKRIYGEPPEDLRYTYKQKEEDNGNVQ